MYFLSTILEDILFEGASRNQHTSVLLQLLCWSLFPQAHIMQHVHQNQKQDLLLYAVPIGIIYTPVCIFWGQTPVGLLVPHQTPSQVAGMRNIQLANPLGVAFYLLKYPQNGVTFKDDTTTGEKDKFSRISHRPIATYNSRTLASEEKLLEIEEELTHINWHFLGLCEIRRRGESMMTVKSGHVFYHSGYPNKSDGSSGFLIHKKKHAKDIITIKSISPRLFYFPSLVEEFYEDIRDFNAVGRKQKIPETILHNFRLGERNERGDMLINFFPQQNVHLMNSFFQKKELRRTVSANLDKTLIDANDIEAVNNTILNAIKRAENRYCKKKDNNDHKLRQSTKHLMRFRRELPKEEIREQLRSLNKDISKEVRNYLRKFNDDSYYITQTIEENKSMKILRKNISNGKK
ncbi:hypothetical protein HUJ04_000431 [Dendroctonus ponderosae]|nr:hypothetical protein HUJ04_000431 [Dendroctonus ponderosae]